VQIVMDGGVVNRFGPKVQKSNQNRKRRQKWWKYIHQGDSNPSPPSPGFAPLTVGHAHVCDYIRTPPRRTPQTTQKKFFLTPKPFFLYAKHKFEPQNRTKNSKK
jgi:hypothetical protein